MYAGSAVAVFLTTVDTRPNYAGIVYRRKTHTYVHLIMDIYSDFHKGGNDVMHRFQYFRLYFDATCISLGFALGYETLFHVLIFTCCMVRTKDHGGL